MENISCNARRDPAERIHYRKNKYAAPTGMIYLLLAVIGLVAVIFFCVQFTRALLDNTNEKEKFEKIITPVVMFDPAPFEKAADADPLFLLQASLWSTLLSDKRESYLPDPNDPNNPLGNLVVPRSDVDVTCDRLFGSDVKLQHQGFGNYETVYEYQDGVYYVPVSSDISMYSPSVERVVKSGDVYTLTVGYIPPSNPWTQAISGETGKPAAAKYMLYELTKVKDHFQLTAIRYDTESTQALYAPMTMLPVASSSEPQENSTASSNVVSKPSSEPEMDEFAQQNSMQSKESSSVDLSSSEASSADSTEDSSENQAASSATSSNG